MKPLIWREDIGGCYFETLGPLMTRWHLIDQLWRGIRAPFQAIYLHLFHRSDEDRELHDHPWPFVSVVLWGGYTEVRPVECLRRMIEGGGEKAGFTFTDATTVERKFYPPGSILIRPAWWAHRIEIEDGVKSLSLVFVGWKVRSWGFFTKAGWRPWKEFTATRDCG